MGSRIPSRADFEEISKLCEEYEVKSGKSVSYVAQRVITDIVIAIRADPHISWRGKEDFIREDVIQNLIAYLGSVAKEERVKSRIGTFDLLHWLTSNLARICPIEKR